jgi:hypothetical protein
MIWSHSDNERVKITKKKGASAFGFGLEGVVISQVSLLEKWVVGD